MKKLTPMMEQYKEIKSRYIDSILFFRLGDFYEMFFEDAITASRELEITLTARDCGLDEKAPMCGIPFHSANNYIITLVEKGYKVAICEQTEDPSKAKGIVKRDVVKVVTIGTLTDTSKIDEKTNNFLLSIYQSEESTGIVYTDITTGEMRGTTISKQKHSIENEVLNEINKINPKEIIGNINISEITLSSRLKENYSLVDEEYFNSENALENIYKQFGEVEKLKEDNLVKALGGLLKYLETTQKQLIENITNIDIYDRKNFMSIDANTRRNLELIETLLGKTKKGSLLGVLDKTSTAMGGRLIKKWIEEPLLDRKKIEKRHDLIEYLVNNPELTKKLQEELKGIYDIERLIGKISYGNCNGRDMISLKNSIFKIPRIKLLLEEMDNENFQNIGKKIDLLEDIYKIIDRGIEEEPPIGIKEGGLIKSDYNEELKSLRDISLNGKTYLLEIENRERQRLGIKNLKVSYNKVFGYFIELSKSHIDKAPPDYERKQTLSNAERYITEELKDIENKILGSQDKMISLEYSIFLEIREKIKSEIVRVQKIANILSFIDVINSFGTVAYYNNYSRPIISKDDSIKIVKGRHPVVETMINEGEFIDNDTLLDCSENRTMIITGPNMAGKSTYMRQVALITLMSQIGSFIPADYGELSIVDKIFTRIGASDDLSEGKSTFMVEMSEVANILENGTKNSLIILDEVGRGTSTFDGLSIAWAVLEYISNKKNMGSKTLFATHYHELTELEGKIDGVSNYKIKVKDGGKGDVIFLRKIEKGKADRSYGIEVAKLAGVREEVLERAYEILEQLEENDLNNNRREQISLFDELKEKPKVEKIKKSENKENSKYKTIVEEAEKIDILKLNPMEAMNKLYFLLEEIKKIKE